MTTIVKNLIGELKGDVLGDIAKVPKNGRKGKVWKKKGTDEIEVFANSYSRQKHHRV